MATDWGKVLNMKFSKIMLALIFGLFLVIVLVGTCSKKHINLWGLEFNEKQKTDTVVVTQTIQPPKDSLYKANPVEIKAQQSTPIVIKQYVPEIDKKKLPPDTPIKNQTNNIGNNNRSVTGDNNQVLNGDINITNDRRLSTQELKNIVALVDSAKKQFSLKSDTIVLDYYSGGNAGIYQQLKQTFKQIGYIVDDQVTMGVMPKGVWVWHDKKGHAKVTVGTFQ